MSSISSNSTTYGPNGPIDRNYLFVRTSITAPSPNNKEIQTRLNMSYPDTSPSAWVQSRTLTWQKRDSNTLPTPLPLPGMVESSVSQPDSQGSLAETILYDRYHNINTSLRIAVSALTAENPEVKSQQAFDANGYQEGTFVNNLLEGEGFKIQPQVTEIGHFKKGKLHGEGIKIDYCNGMLLRIVIAIFDNGKIREPRKIRENLFKPEDKFHPIPSPQTYINFESLKNDPLFTGSLAAQFDNCMKIKEGLRAPTSTNLANTANPLPKPQILANHTLHTIELKEESDLDPTPKKNLFDYLCCLNAFPKR